MNRYGSFLIATQIPHRDPWWTCLGCWKVIFLVTCVVIWAGLVIAEHLA